MFENSRKIFNLIHSEDRGRPPKFSELDGASEKLKFKSLKKTIVSEPKKPIIFSCMSHFFKLLRRA